MLQRHRVLMNYTLIGVKCVCLCGNKFVHVCCLADGKASGSPAVGVVGSILTLTVANQSSVEIEFFPNVKLFPVQMGFCWG